MHSESFGVYISYTVFFNRMTVTANISSIVFEQSRKVYSYPRNKVFFLTSRNCKVIEEESKLFGLNLKGSVHFVRSYR